MELLKTEEKTKIKINDSLLIEGDVLHTLQLLPSESIQCVITSPPYWGVRDYGIEGQLGNENTLIQYLNRIITVFSEIKRVLIKDGVLWINIGDGYTSGNRRYRSPDKKNKARAMPIRPETPIGLKRKDLLGVPWRIAFALQDDGWFLRSDIIWHKPNAMPESVKDRPSRDHEYLFMFTKSERYFYNLDAIKVLGVNGNLRNRRSVWSINTQAFHGSHFATFPTELVAPCLLSSSMENSFVLDPFAGTGTVGIVCQKFNRKFVGIELNPQFISIAYSRINNMSDNLNNIASK